MHTHMQCTPSQWDSSRLDLELYCSQLGKYLCTYVYTGVPLYAIDPSKQLTSLIKGISDTRPQGCTDLQSPVKCLDHRGILSDTVCSHASLC